MTEPLTFLDFFSGVGGFRKGFELCGMICEGHCEIDKFADRSFSTLSGGEQQRVILARALAQQTPALLLDEPTNHLDITHQIMLMKLVKNLDVTVISAIHDLNIAAAYCDRIYVLKDGVLEGEGTPKEVLTPELIWRIYKVESEVVYDSQGKMHILFL